MVGISGHGKQILASTALASGCTYLGHRFLNIDVLANDTRVIAASVAVSNSTARDCAARDCARYLGNGPN